MNGCEMGVHYLLICFLFVTCYGVDLQSILTCPEDVEAPFEIDENGKLFANVSWTEPEINGTAIGTNQWSLTRAYNPGDIFPFGDTVVEYTLLTGSDSATCNFTISVVDNEDPIITGCPGDEKIDIVGEETTAEFTWTEPTATDNSGQVMLSSTHQPGDEFHSGTTNVVYTAVDNGGNSVQCSFQVTVLGYPLNAYARTDNVYIVGEDEKVITTNEIDCLLACIEETEFVCHSVDFREADSQCSLSRKDISIPGVIIETNTSYVHWKRLIDNTAPSVDGCPYDLIRPTIKGVNYTNVQWQPPVFRDSSAIEVTNTHSPGDLFYIGAVEVTYTAIDTYENTASCTFTITIEDTENPELSTCPNSINFVIPDSYTSDQTEEITWDPPSCTDNSYSYDLTTSQEPGSVFIKGATTVIYTCKDEGQNVANCEFTVTVKTLDELSRIDIKMELLNFAYSDALTDRRSEQFKALESDLLSLFDDLYGDEDNYEESVVNNFSPGSVLADITLTFFDTIDDELQRYYLDKLLQQTVPHEFGDFIIGQISVRDDNGEYVQVDACYTLPCPDDMVCQALGLQCNAVCDDNPDYCLNDATCVPEDNLIGCSCTSSDYYGIRCQIVDKWSQAEIAAIIFGCVWGALLLFVLVLFVTCKCIDLCQQPRKHGSVDSVLIEKANYEFDNKVYVVDPSMDQPDDDAVFEGDDISETDGDLKEEQKDTYHYTGSIDVEDEISIVLGSDGKVPSVSGSGRHTPSVSGSTAHTPSVSGSNAYSESGSDYQNNNSASKSQDHSGSGSSRGRSISGSTIRAHSVTGS